MIRRMLTLSPVFFASLSLVAVTPVRGDDVKLSPGAHTLVFQNAGSGTICLDAVELGLIERIPSGTMVMAR